MSNQTVFGAWQRTFSGWVRVFRYTEQSDALHVKHNANVLGMTASVTQSERSRKWLVTVRNPTNPGPEKTQFLVTKPLNQNSYDKR